MLDLKGKENIIFDLGGVLLNIDYNLTSRAFVDLGFDDFDVFYSQKQQTELFDLFETGKIGSEEFLEKLLLKIPNVSSGAVSDAWNAMLLDLPQSRLELLRSLRKDFRIFLLSNTNQIHEEAFTKIINERYENNVLEDIFEKVHLSHKIGLRKPTQECFNFVLESSDLDPNKTIFIDDSMQHVFGANQIGISGYLLEKGKEITQIFPDRSQQAFH